MKAGDEIQVQILKFDKDKRRISLGRKQLLPDPWGSGAGDDFPWARACTEKWWA